MMNASHPSPIHSYQGYRRASEQLESFQNVVSQQTTHFSAPSADDPRPRFSSTFSNHPNTPRQPNYRLPRPFPVPLEERRPSAGYAFAHLGPMATPMPDAQADPRRGSFDQQFMMVPTYVPMYQHAAGLAEQWQNQNLPQGAPWSYGNPYAVPGYGLVQRPLPPGPPGPVEKPKRRRAPPAPQYLHMTVQEMIEELAYREVDTQLMQARKAKKAEYIDQLQKADREGKFGRGAWKSCHGDVPPIRKNNL